VTLPQVLTIQILKSDKEQGTIKPEAEMNQKNKSKVTIPEFLDVENDFGDHDHGVGLYKLCGVIDHYGQSVNSGHYTATTLVGEKWYRWDDDMGQVVVSGPDLFSQYTYMLSYKRVPRSARSVSTSTPQGTTGLSLIGTMDSKQRKRSQQKKLPRKKQKRNSSDSLTRSAQAKKDGKLDNDGCLKLICSRLEKVKHGKGAGSEEGPIERNAKAYHQSLVDELEKLGAAASQI
jgi:uncharacterized UBP type Zn finger protein